jgi:hypothetical protein
MLTNKEIKAIWQENVGRPEAAVKRFIAEQIEEVEAKTKHASGLNAAIEQFDQRIEKIAASLPEDEVQALYDCWNELFCQICRSERAFYQQGLADGQRIPRAMRTALKPEAILPH